MGASVVGASVVGSSVVGASDVGATVVGTSVVRASVLGASVVGASVVDASAVGASDMQICPALLCVCKVPPGSGCVLRSVLPRLKEQSGQADLSAFVLSRRCSLNLGWRLGFGRLEGAGWGGDGYWGIGEIGNTLYLMRKLVMQFP